MLLSSILSAKGDFVATISPGTPVAELTKALTQHKVGALVVSTDGRTINGIVSERDVVKALAHGTADLDSPVSAIMTSEVFTAPADTHVDELMAVMTERRFRHIPVTDENGMLIGIVSIGDVVKTRLGELEDEKAALLEYISQ
jgi:CBS domain-containing protein